MSKTKIEWCDYTINPVKGKCPVGCSYCYARRMYDRFKWNPEIRFAQWDNPGCFDVAFPKGAKIFVGSTMELFGEWVKPEWMQTILWWCRNNPDQIFIFLTKRPENLIKWSPFPKNCWIGVSTNGNDCRSGLEDIFANIRATVKFVSIEPLLDYSPMDFRWVDWVIVGRQTPASPKTAPKIEWVKEIVEAADKAGVPVFLKHKMHELLMTGAWDDDIFWANEKTTLRQEFPKVEVRS